MSYNRVILLGNLTRDIQLRFTPGGMPVADMGLAMSEKRKQGEEWIEEAVFVDVTLWGRTAEIANEYLKKGSPVFIEGKLKFETWEKDGQKHNKLKVVADRLQLVGSRDGSGGNARSSGLSVPSNPGNSGSGSDAGYQDEDLPF